MSGSLPGTALVATLLAVCPAIGLAHPVDSPEVVAKPLSEVVAISNIIFAGTVEQVKRSQDQRMGEITMVTFKDVIFVKGAKPGKATLRLPVNRDATALVRNGVTISAPPRGVTKAEAAGSFIDGLPVFHQGSRYVVLAAGWGSPQDGFLPIPLEEGFFIVRERANGVYLMDSAGRPLVGIEDGCLGVVDSTFGAGTPTRERYLADGSILTASEPISQDSLITKSHVVMGRDGLPALRIYPSRADTGERMTESAFLDAMRRLKLNKEN